MNLKHRWNADAFLEPKSAESVVVLVVEYILKMVDIAV
jgi:hypothetical protein